MTDDARTRLLALRSATLDRLAALHGEHAAVVDASRDSNADDEHDPEGATIAYERAQVTALLAQAREDLDALGRALAEVERTGRVRCEGCGEPIAFERLLALPTARTCIRCATRPSTASFSGC